MVIWKRRAVKLMRRCDDSNSNALDSHQHHRQTEPLQKEVKMADLFATYSQEDRDHGKALAECAALSITLELGTFYRLGAKP